MDRSACDFGAFSTGSLGLKRSMHDSRPINISEQIPLLESKLGIELGFFEKLGEETDWAFVIKLHALVEAAVSHLLVRSLGNDALLGTVSHLELSNKKAGKVAFIKDLGLLDEAERRFISSLSELRNQLVHNISNVNFRFHEHVQKMDKQQFKAFLTNFNLISTEVTDDIRKFFYTDPQQATWYSGMVLLGIIYLKHEEQF